MVRRNRPVITVYPANLDVKGKVLRRWRWHCEACGQDGTTRYSNPASAATGGRLVHECPIGGGPEPSPQEEGGAPN